MTREEIKRIALKVGFDDGEINTCQLMLENFDVLVASAERSACAKLLEEALAQREQKPVAWKLVPIEPTDEMLKAMDECSTEGYDERLYAGHAASVYMAAVDVAPNPIQRTWVGLTEDEIKALASWWPSYDQMPALMVLAKDIQNSLKEKNT